MVSDFGDTRYCKKCEGEIVRKGDVITMYAGKKICKCKDEVMSKERNPAHYCMGCNKEYIGQRGFCCQKCHDEYYDELGGTKDD